MVYWIVFSLSSLFLAVGEKTKFNFSSHKVFCTISWFGVLVLAFFAGIRSFSIGVDTEGYYKYFLTALNSPDIKSLMENAYLGRVGLEPIFRLVLFFSARITDNFNFCCFVVSALTECFILLFARRKNGMFHEEYDYTWLIVLVFNVLLYGRFMNQMRQGLAIAVFSYASTWIEDKKWVKGLIFSFIAGLIHYSAFVALPIALLIFVFCDSSLAVKIRRRRCWIIILGSIALIVLFPTILYNIISSLPDYSVFLDQFLGSHRRFSLIIFLLRIPLIVLSFVYGAKIRRFDKNYYLFFCLNIMDLILTLWASGAQIERISFYLYFAKIAVIVDLIRANACVINAPDDCSNKDSFRDGSNSLVVGSYSQARRVIFLSVVILALYWFIYNINNFYGFGYPVYPFQTVFSDTYLY